MSRRMAITFCRDTSQAGAVRLQHRRSGTGTQHALEAERLVIHKRFERSSPNAHQGLSCSVHANLDEDVDGAFAGTPLKPALRTVRV
jgi:hypothetical protein